MTTPTGGAVGVGSGGQLYVVRSSGIRRASSPSTFWIPAFAGMTKWSAPRTLRATALLEDVDLALGADLLELIGPDGDGALAEVALAEEEHVGA